MWEHQLRKVLLRPSSVEQVFAFSSRNKSEVTKTAFRSSSLGDRPRDVSKNPQEESTTALSSETSSGTLNTTALGSKPNSKFPSRENNSSSPENTGLQAEYRVLDFDEIPCPGLIKWTSKLIGYIPSLSTQFTANLVRNGTLPIQHLLDNYGPIVRLSGPLGGPIILVARPDLLQTVFAEEGKEPEGIGFDSLRHYRQQKRVDTSPSAQWVSISGPLSSMQTRAAVTAATSHVDAPLIAGLEISADKFIATVRSARSPQGEVNIDAALREWAVESAIFTAFGQTLQEALGDDDGVEQTHAAFVTASEALRACESGLQLWRWAKTPSWARFESSLDILHQNLGKRVWAECEKLQKEQSAEKPRWVLDALLSAGLHPDVVISTIVELLLVAANTTACATGMLLYELSRHQREQRAVLDEVSPNLASPRAKFQGGLPQMTYLRACIKEVLRLHPPVQSLSRVLPKPVRLHQYYVPQGTVVVLAAAQCARRADQFEDADRFRPHRWLEDDPGRHPLAVLPWGWGARACPAASIAATQVAILAAKTVRSFHLEHEYGELHVTGQVLGKPSKPLKIRFVDRTN